MSRSLEVAVPGQKGFVPADPTLTARHATINAHTISFPLFGCDREIKAFALVDVADDWVLNYRWAASGRGYVSRHVGQGKHLFLHRELLGLRSGQRLEVDHINGDPLDNRRYNLRIATHALNQQNRTRPGWGTSKYRGVSWNKNRGRWQVFCQLNGNNQYLGLYDDEEEAAAVAAAWRAEHMPFSAEGA